ncbi:MAG: enoyl-CoA hydratase/isomerase family protein [Chloroflexi bacterium]|nr:enoyl-CoA hydratase/isomerase family protein [Chloroflexota bacterium]
MEFETLIYDKRDFIGTITLNRPERLNAISRTLSREFTGLLQEIERDDEVRVIILTGAPRADGRPCFSAGYDLLEMREKGLSSAAQELGHTLEEGLLRTLQGVAEGIDARSPLFTKVVSLRKPTIAAIDGTCTAGGFELALCCDLRIAAETAQFSDLHMKNLGSIGGAGLQTLLPRIVGIARAKELIWTGDVIDGRRAEHIGLVNRVCAPDQLMNEARKLAQQLAAMRPTGMQVSKIVINASTSQSTYDSLRFSDLCSSLLRYMSPEDQKESFEAFAQKRNPNFRDR